MIRNHTAESHLEGLFKAQKARGPDLTYQRPSSNNNIDTTHCRFDVYCQNGPASLRMIMPSFVGHENSAASSL